MADQPSTRDELIEHRARAIDPGAFLPNSKFSLHAMEAARRTVEADEAAGLLPLPLETMLAACIPGGDICDPQEVADAIRRYVAASPFAPPKKD